MYVIHEGKPKSIAKMEKCAIDEDEDEDDDNDEIGD